MLQSEELSSLLGLQADALEHALIAALPLGPQSAAGGISLPDSFHGELQVGHSTPTEQPQFRLRVIEPDLGFKFMAQSRADHQLHLDCCL